MQQHSLLSKLAYAAGTVSFAVKDIAFGSFVLFYYVSVVGLQGSLAGLVLLISMIWDAVTDPIVGSLSDNLRSRWGRRHPFMAISGIPLAICLYALFDVPHDLTQTEIFIWMLVVCLLLRTFLTLFTVPYLALGAEMSEDYHERSSIAGIRTLFGWVTAIGLAAFAWGYIFKSDGITDGRLIEQNYFIFGTISFFIVAIFTTLSLLFTARHIPNLPKGTETPDAFSFAKVFLDIRLAMQNKNFRYLFYVMLTLGVGAGVGGALATHMATYFWELTTRQLFYQTLFNFVPITFMLLIMGWISKHFEKHHILQICTFIFAANGIWLIGLRLLDILPANGDPLIFSLILVYIFIGAANLIWFQTMTSSVIADIGDEQEYLTHQRQEGMFFAAQGFSIKFVSGIGNFIGGIVLEVIELPVNAAPGSVPADTLFQMGIVVGPILSLFTLIPFLFARKITLTRERHDQIRAELDARAAA